MTADPAEAADEFRKRAGLRADARVDDILVTAEGHLGFHVYVLELPGGAIEGAYIEDRDDRFIFVGASQPGGQRHHPTRQRFTLAHELGHGALGHGVMLDAIVGDDVKGDPQEEAADAFASAFLMPAQGIEAWLEERRLVGVADVDTFVSLAGHFGVSSPAAWRRLAAEDQFASAPAAQMIARAVWGQDKEANRRRNQLGLMRFEDTLQDVFDSNAYRMPAALTTRVDHLLAHEIFDHHRARDITDGRPRPPRRPV